MANLVPNQAAETACEVCAGTRTVPDAHELLVRCRACGHRWYRDLALLDLTQIYGEAYHERAEYLQYVRQRPTLVRNFRRYLAWMRGYGAAGGPLLEVGCAHGFFLHEAADAFDPVEGVDLSDTAVRWAREQLGVQAHRAELPELGAERAYAAICMWDTIEHLAHPRRYVAAASSRLVEHGWLFLTTGDAGSAVARWRGRRWRMIHPPTHLHYFSRASLRALLESEGFEVVGIRAVGVRRDLLNMLHGLSRFGSSRALRALAGRLARHAPAALLRRDLYLNLYDIMFVAARKLPTSHA